MSEARMGLYNTGGGGEGGGDMLTGSMTHCMDSTESTVRTNKFHTILFQILIATNNNRVKII
jgi:hypothetical protein